MRQRFSLVLAVALCLVASCSSEGAGPATTGGSEPTGPPWGLETVDLPDDEPSLSRLWEAMPSSFDGLPLTVSGPDAVVYDDGGERYLSVRAVSIAGIPSGPEGEPITARGFLGMMVEVELETVTASQVGEGEPLVYVVGATTGDDQVMHTAFWAEAGSDWVFAAVGDTDEVLSELVSSFVEACRQSN